ncbi:MAG: branched-chain amino acid ABC transporter permease [Chloroflexi bacterium]|nr:branched-chain amino acid ABC transporter permease [Chloroflexota bacterium]
MRKTLFKHKAIRIVLVILGFAGLLILFWFPQINQNMNLIDISEQRSNEIADLYLLLVLASSWNLFSGMTGSLDFGHTVYFGLGAYFTAIAIVSLEYPWLLAAGLAILCTILCAIIVGTAILPLRGGYFSIATLAILFVTRVLVTTIRSITGGNSGLVATPAFDPQIYYWAAFGTLIVIVVAIYGLRLTEIREILAAIRTNDLIASVRGIPVLQYKLFIYVLSAAFSSLVGSIWFYRHTFVQPNSVFVETDSFELIVICVVGGTGTFVGPLVGGLMLYMLSTMFSTEWKLILESVALILAILYLPGGISRLLLQQNTDIDWLQLIKLERHKNHVG